MPDVGSTGIASNHLFGRWVVAVQHAGLLVLALFVGAIAEGKLFGEAARADRDGLEVAGLVAGPGDDIWQGRRLAWLEVGVDLDGAVGVVVNDAGHRVNPVELSRLKEQRSQKVSGSAREVDCIKVAVPLPSMMRTSEIAAGLIGVLVWMTGNLAIAQDKPTAIMHARLITPITPTTNLSENANKAGVRTIQDSVLLLQHGKILAVGDAQTVQLATDVVIIDAKGKTLIPGLVDSHSHVGGIGGADGSGSIQPDVRVLDSINPSDSGFNRARSGGLTTINIMPGSGHLLSGQTIYVKLRKATTIEGMYFYPDQATAPKTMPWPPGGIKMANGTNSLGAAPFPGTRGKSAALVRERYIKAQEYQNKWAKYREKVGKGENADVPDRDIGLDALVECLEGTRIVHFHTHRADDIMTVIRLQKEFGFRLVLHHTSEAWKVADELAQIAKDEPKFMGCSIILVDSPGGKLEAANMRMDTGAMLEKAGVPTSIHTDDWINDSRFFRRCGALAIRYGMSRDAALRALTIDGAKMLDLADSVGSLEVGKDADFVILDGDPFSVYTKVEQTWIDGAKVFDLSNEADRLFATGGFGAGRDQEPYLCCAPNGGFSFGGKVWGN